MPKQIQPNVHLQSACEEAKQNQKNVNARVCVCVGGGCVSHERCLLETRAGEARLRGNAEVVSPLRYALRFASRLS